MFQTSCVYMQGHIVPMDLSIGPMDLSVGPMDLSVGPMDLSLVSSTAERVPHAMTTSSFDQAAGAMIISSDNEITFSIETIPFSTSLLPLRSTENDNNLTGATTGTSLSTPYHSVHNLEEILPNTESSDFAFLFAHTASTDATIIQETQAEHSRDNNDNNTVIRHRNFNVPQERRDENVRTITELVLSEENRNNRYTGYTMLLQFAQTIENNIHSAVNGEGDYSQYFTATVDVIRRTLTEWKHDNQNLGFGVSRDLFGMNMQDLINNANPRCALLLSNPVTSTGVFNPITTHVISNSVTTPVLSNASTVPVLSNTTTTLSSESTLEVNQPAMSTANSSNENLRNNNNRFVPYQPINFSSLRLPRLHRSRPYARVYSVCFYSKSILPLRVNRSSTFFIMETVIDILVDDGENNIRGRLVELLVVKHGYHHITQDNLVFLKSARRQLDLPVSPPEFQWNGDKIRRLIGSGKLHVMVQIEMMAGSSLDASCLVDVCERNDPRRRQLSGPVFSSPRSRLDRLIASRNGSVEFMEAEEAVIGATRNMTNQSQPHRPNAAGSSEGTNDKITRALREHAGRVVKGFKRFITVRREDLWNSAMEFFKKPNFCKAFGTLSVKFQLQDGITEEALDFNGPRREFFRLLIAEICQKSGALVETPNGLVPRNNVRQLKEGVLRHIGRMISTIVLQGGEAPAIFCPIITQCILNDPVSTKPDVDDIPDLVIRESLKLVQLADNEESLEKALNSCDWRFDVDGLPLFVKMENKEEFIQASSMYFAILQRQTGIQQLLQGLEYYDFLGLMKRKPFVCSILEYKKRDVFTKDLIPMLKPEYSYMACRKVREEKLFSNLKEFLQLVEDGTLLHRFNDEMAVLTTEEREFISTMKPSKLLEFCTGSSKIPVLGFKYEPNVSFIHTDRKFHPSAHTCGNKLVLYVNDKTVNDKSSFFKIMVETLMNAENFGFG